MKKKQLHLPMKEDWYKAVDSGWKPEEYRELSHHWLSRICQYYKQCSYKGIRPRCINELSCPFCAKITPKVSEVVMHKGYKKDTTMTRMNWKIREIVIGKGDPKWGAPDYPVLIIRLGERITEECQK